MKDEDVVIVDAARTACGSFLGPLSALRAPDLGSAVIKGLLERNPSIEAARVDEVIMGNVIGAGIGQNPARQAALSAGLPYSVEAYTLNMVCGSGLKAVMEAANAIRAGEKDIVIAGGMESMSNAPYLLPKARTGYRLGNAELVDAMVHDGLWEFYNDFHMGMTAELVAEEYGITRQQQDAYAAETTRRAVEAIDAGRFRDEIIPVSVSRKKQEPLVFDTTDVLRRNTTLEKLAALRPVFKPDGTVTAGNASSLADGAAAVIVARYDAAKKTGLKPVARITGYCAAGVDPKWLMLAPIDAVRKLMEMTGYATDDFDLVELNEAFAVQPVVVLDELGIEGDRVNVNGGAVALGHPVGATGAKILTTLIHAMGDRDAALGLATLCLGGGNAVAMSVERC